MKIIRGIKLGGLQQKIFNLVLIFILALVGAYVAVSIHQYRTLGKTVTEAGDRQQESITQVSEETMQAVLEQSMTQSTGLQAYIADDLFSDVEGDVLTLQAFLTGLFENRDSFDTSDFDPARYTPTPVYDGAAVVQLQHEAGVDPADSADLPLLAHASDVMLAMFKSSQKLNSCLIATTDGNILFVDDRSAANFDADGNLETFEVRSRPWYTQAVEAGELIFTGIELDAFTDIPGLVCAAPVYVDGELMAVVGADIFLASIEDYVSDRASDSGFLCVVNENGQVIFSGRDEGTFRAALSADTHDLRTDSNTELADFVSKALTQSTGLTALTVDGKDYYVTGAPMGTVGWAVLSVVDRETTRQPTELMLSRYEEINTEATESFSHSLSETQRRTVIVTVVLLVLAIIGALVVAQRIVKPIETMTKRINALSGSDTAFEMEKTYKTNDEIEILAEAFATLSKRTRDYIAQITEITAEKERIGTELALATRIQADMLPNIFPAFPEREEFDIYASMTPAKEVGGDFYDFFLIDESHLGLVMADVSGKGVPAALFMMISKILVQNYAMSNPSPARALEAVNHQICQNNREEMFVTVWLGVLDLNTGTLTAANAGHEYPVLKTPEGDFEIVKDKHGFVIGGMDGLKYKEYTLELKPGAKLFLYTDGAPEATNADNELFGMELLLAALNSRPEADPENILKTVTNAVNAFVQEAPQFDDLTMLCLEYKGVDGMNKLYQEITVPAEIDKLPEVLGFLERELEAADCPPKTQMQIAVAAEEIFVNIAHYAYALETGEATVRLEIGGEPKTATVTFLDSGVPFDPLQKPDPDVTLSAEEREIGGLGIYMTKKTMDEVAYEYSDGKNILTLKKKL